MHVHTQCLIEYCFGRREQCWKHCLSLSYRAYLVIKLRIWTRYSIALEMPGGVIFSTLVPGSGSFQLTNLMGYS